MRPSPALLLTLTLALPALLAGCTSDPFCGNDEDGPCNVQVHALLVTASFEDPWDRALAEETLVSLGYTLEDVEGNFSGDDVRGVHLDGHTIRILVPTKHIEHGNSSWVHLVEYPNDEERPLTKRAADAHADQMRIENRPLYEAELERFMEETGWRPDAEIQWRPRYTYL